MALQIRRGTNAERLDFTPVEGEIIFITDSQLVTIEGAEADTTNRIITCGAEHGLKVNQKIKLISNDGFGLTEGQVYYVLESGLTTLSFKLSLTQGGSAVALTTAETPEGTGPIFAVGPTDVNGVPYGYSIAPVWAGDGITTGGIAAGAAVLDELSDVTIGVDGFYGVGLSAYQHLQYDGVTNQWRNVSNVVVPGTFYAGGAATLNSSLTVRGNTTLGNESTDTVTFTGTNVSIPNNLSFDSNTLYIDAANNTVGIGGQAGTGYKFDVGGNARVIGTLTAETNLSVKGNTTLGDASGDLVTFNAATVNTPNNLDFLGSGGSIGMHYDYTNRRLGIRTITPSVELDINGQLYVSDKGEINGNLEVNGNTTLGDSSGDTLTLNGYNLYIPNSLSIDNGTVIIDSGTNRIGFATAPDASYRVNVEGGIQTSGDININGSDLRTDSTTFNILPGNATTINIGSTSGTTVVKNNLTTNQTITAQGVVSITNTTESFNPDSGALQVDGGVGINKHLHVGGSISVDNTDASTGPTSGSIQTDGGLGVVGDANIGGTLTVGGNLVVNGSTTTINSVTLSVDDKNIELGSVSGYSDATADGGGITLKGTTDKTILWENAYDWWKFNQSIYTPKAYVANLQFANTENNTISTASGDLNLTAVGQVNVLKDLEVQGNFKTYDNFIRLNSDVVDVAPSQNCGITIARGTSSDVYIRWNESTDRWQTTVDGTNYITIPNQNLDTTTDVTFNSVTLTSGNLLSTDPTITIGDVDTEEIHLGDNAADPKTVIYANGDLEVHDNLQVLGSTQLGNSVESDSTSVQGSFEVIGQSGILAMGIDRTTRRVKIGVGTATELLSVFGNTTISGNAYIGNDIVVESVVNLANNAYMSGESLTTTSTSQATLDSNDITAIRTVKYVIQANDGTNFHSIEAMVMHDGTSAYMTQYGEMVAGSSVFTLAADVSGGYMRLLVTPASATSTTFRIARTAIKA